MNIRRAVSLLARELHPLSPTFSRAGIAAAKGIVDKVVRLHAAHSVLVHRCPCGQCSPAEVDGTHRLIDDLSRPSTPIDILHRMRRFSEVKS